MKHFNTTYLIVLTILSALLLMPINSYSIEPFEVRVIYFRPVGSPSTPVDRLTQLMQETQEFYRVQMEQNGYGSRSFKIETDANNDIIIHTVDGKHNPWHYSGNTDEEIEKELPYEFTSANEKSKDNVHVIIVGGLRTVYNGAWGVGWTFSGWRAGGNAVIAGHNLNMPIIAHEIGHAFGLFHNEVDNTMMGPNHGPMLDYEVRWLAKSHYFNDEHIRTDIPQFVEYLGIEAIGKDIIKFKFSAHSESGLYHSKVIRIRGGLIVLGHDDLTSKDDIAEINVPRSSIINGDTISFRIMDVNGNYIYEDISIQTASPGPKIKGPWLWVLIPGKQNSSLDLLAAASGGKVTELEVATKGAKTGEVVGNSKWKPYTLPNTGGDNINIMLDAAGIPDVDRQNHIIYGSIALNSPTEQDTTMFVGADDGVKIWLNGELVDHTFVFGGASDYKRDFPVTLKQGKNVLLVAVDNRFGIGWSGFFGFATGTKYTLIPPDVPLVFNDGSVFSTDVVRVSVHDTFTLHLNAENVTDLAGWQADIAFDPNMLEAIEVTEGDLLDLKGTDSFWQDGTIDNTIGKITDIFWTGISEIGISGTATLLSVTFRAKVDGETKVTLENFELASIAGDVIPAYSPNIDIIVGEYPAWDVNQDGRVSIVDLVLVARDLGSNTPANLRTDVNRDGVINVQDLILVAQYIGESTDASTAPTMLTIDNEELMPMMVQAWIKQAQTEEDGSLAFRQGIENLQYLLAVLIPENTALLANYPNPFNPETWIPYQLSEPTDVTLTIYDINGRVVRALNMGHQAVGIYHNRSRAAYWDGRNAQGELVASGVYFYTLKAGDFIATRKMLIRK